MSRMLCLPAPTLSPYFATTAILAVALFCCSFFFAAPVAHAAEPQGQQTLTPKQLAVVQALLATYGVGEGKIKAVSAVLVEMPPKANGEHASTTPRPPQGIGSTTPLRMDEKQGTSTRPVVPPPPRPAPTSTSSKLQSSASSVLKFVDDYSDSFNDNLAAVVTAPFKLATAIVVEPPRAYEYGSMAAAVNSAGFDLGQQVATIFVTPFGIAVDALSDIMAPAFAGQ